MQTTGADQPLTRQTDMTKKMTMKQWEKSPMDAKLDKAGKHGPEGSAKDKAADKRDLAAYNSKMARGSAKKGE